jgi:hypothetical protein
MGVDWVGLAAAAAGVAGRLLALDDRQAGGADRAGQADPVAAGALDGHHQPWSRGVVEDPGQHLGVAAGGVADLAGGDDRAVGVGDLDFVGVAVGVDTDDGIDEFCKDGHRPVSLRGQRSSSRRRSG